MSRARYTEYDRALESLWLPFLQELGFTCEGKEAHRRTEEFRLAVEIIPGRIQGTPGTVALMASAKALCFESVNAVPYDLISWQVRGPSLEHQESYVAEWGVWDKRCGIRTVADLVEAFETLVVPGFDEYEGAVSERLVGMNLEAVDARRGLPHGMEPGHAAALICWLLDREGKQDAARPFREQFKIKEGEYRMNLRAAYGPEFPDSILEYVFGKGRLE